MKQTLLILGAGGQARSALNVAFAAGFEVLGFIDPAMPETSLLGYPVFPSYLPYLTGQHRFVLGVGANYKRDSIFHEICMVLEQVGFESPADFFPPLIHPFAVISLGVSIGAGTLIMPNSTVGPFSTVGQGCIINTNASIDHDCTMNNFASIAPGAHTGGNVQLATRSVVGLAAAVKQGVKIGSDAILGAKSYLNKDLPANAIAFGSPARVRRSRTQDEPYF